MMHLVLQMHIQTHNYMYVVIDCATVIGASLSEPHIDRDNVPRARKNGMSLSIYLCTYVCIIYPAFVAPWFPRSMYALKCSVYDMLTCVIYNSTRSTEQQRRLELLVSAVKIIDKDAWTTPGSTSTRQKYCQK